MLLGDVQGVHPDAGSNSPQRRAATFRLGKEPAVSSVSPPCTRGKRLGCHGGAALLLELDGARVVVLDNPAVLTRSPPTGRPGSGRSSCRACHDGLNLVECLAPRGRPVRLGRRRCGRRRGGDVPARRRLTGGRLGRTALLPRMRRWMALKKTPATASRTPSGSWEMMSTLPVNSSASPGPSGRTPARSEASRLVRTAPNRAVSNNPPRERKNVADEVAMPRSRASTAFCTAINSTRRTCPTPAPKALHSPMTKQASSGAL
jgi:hypothetical protein